MRWLLLPFLLLPLSVAIPGCSSDDDKPKDANAGKVCTARKTIFCRCPKTGEGGWQTCLPDGSGFDECVPCDGTNLDPAGGGGSSPVNPNVDAECGNGKTELGEECDDGNFDDDDGCLSDCRKAKCGDGLTYSGVEECDDGNTDDDDGCTKACTLKTPSSDACAGDMIEVTPDPAGKKVAGEYKALKPNHEGSCGGLGNDAVFSFTAPGDGEVEVSVSVLDGAKVDAVLYVREAECDSSTKELICVNTGGEGANEATGPIAVAKGSVYYAFVDSQNEAPGGFSLRVRFRPDEACEGQGGPCEATSAKGRCAQGTLSCSTDKQLVCQPGQPAAQETCGDGIDDDCNGVPDNGCPCSHSICDAGVAMAADCSGSADSDCLKKICEKDDYCCTVEWDKQCTDQVLTVCGVGKCLRGDCVHPLCQAGAALTQGCDGAAKCVEAVCKTDSFCCGKEWDSTCVGKLADICQIKCE